MKTTFQDKNAKQTILDHGISVWKKFDELYKYLLDCDNSQESLSEYQYPLPKWLLQHKDYLIPFLTENLKSIKTYLILHDCGKPFCLTEDEIGQHFKNHAQISKETYLKYYDNQMVAQLIGDDMLCHITKPKDYEALIDHPNIEILLCAALAELHSNAIMFGGFDSDSFKIKFKNLSKLGERILNNKRY